MGNQCVLEELNSVFGRVCLNEKIYWVLMSTSNVCMTITNPQIIFNKKSWLHTF